jgi:hypothetical protein
MCLCVIGLLAAAPALAHPPPYITRCPPDSVLVGQICVDTYEASLWQVPPTNSAGASNTSLLFHIKTGIATLADLTAGNAIQISPSSSSSCTSSDPTKTCSTCDAPPFPATFPGNGQWTQPLYAVSIPGVRPTACVTWFQAGQACRLSGKRLLTNLEWQDAAAGTPDTTGGADNGTTDCNINSVLHAVETGSRSNCKSSWGAHDMVGNVDEWVAEWVPYSTGCPGWGSFSEDFMCLSGASETAQGPGALMRGGNYVFGAQSGVFSTFGGDLPYATEGKVGFRCVR